MNKFKVRDRVRINNPLRVSNTRLGTVIRWHVDDFGDAGWMVQLDRLPTDSYSNRLKYKEPELELDKNSIVINILNDL